MLRRLLKCLGKRFRGFWILFFDRAMRFNQIFYIGLSYIFSILPFYFWLTLIFGWRTVSFNKARYVFMSYDFFNRGTSGLNFFLILNWVFSLSLSLFGHWILVSLRGIRPSFSPEVRGNIWYNIDIWWTFWKRNKIIFISWEVFAFVEFLGESDRLFWRNTINFIIFWVRIPIRTSYIGDILRYRIRSHF